MTTSQRTLDQLRPRDAEQLHRFLDVVLDLRMPRQALTPGHDAPFDYLWHAHTQGGDGPADCLVWANRGGGKTYLGAVATLLDLLFRPGIQVRILAGSLEQSSRMYGYLQALVQRSALRGVLADKPTQRRIVLRNGSSAEMLAQSEPSVRGVRVHKLRCDEVESFSADIWRAAQMVTRSATLRGEWVSGSIEVMSTMHRPFGLMHQLLQEAQATQRAHVFRWNAIDVIERCPSTRSCDGCVLWDDCRGRARQADGFMHIDDLIAQRRRTDDATWRSEMMCQRPRTHDCVYSMFDAEKHVRNVQHDETSPLIGGMDFGIRNPLVMLWARVTPATDSTQARVHIVDEYEAPDMTLERHLAVIADRGHGQPMWIGVDPAGRQRNSQTGRSDVEVLRQHGHHVRWQRSMLADGVSIVRRRLEQGTLTIEPRCVKLIAAVSSYHFDNARPNDTQPVKDGPDHLCDALRYMLVCLERSSRPVQVRNW